MPKLFFEMGVLVEEDRAKVSYPEKKLEPLKLDKYQDAEIVKLIESASAAAPTYVLPLIRYLSTLPEKRTLAIKSELCSKLPKSTDVLVRFALNDFEAQLPTDMGPDDFLTAMDILLVASKYGNVVIAQKAIETLLVLVDQKKQSVVDQGQSFVGPAQDILNSVAERCSPIQTNIKFYSALNYFDFNSTNIDKLQLDIYTEAEVFQFYKEAMRFVAENYKADDVISYNRMKGFVVLLEKLKTCKYATNVQRDLEAIMLSEYSIFHEFADVYLTLGTNLFIKDNLIRNSGNSFSVLSNLKAALTKVKDPSVTWGDLASFRHRKGTEVRNRVRKAMVIDHEDAAFLNSSLLQYQRRTNTPMSTELFFDLVNLSTFRASVMAGDKFITPAKIIKRIQDMDGKLENAKEVKIELIKRLLLNEFFSWKYWQTMTEQAQWEKLFTVLNGNDLFQEVALHNSALQLLKIMIPGKTTDFYRGITGENARQAEAAKERLKVEIEKQLLRFETVSDEDSLKALNQKAAAFRKFEDDYLDDMTDAQYGRYDKLRSATTAAIEAETAKLAAKIDGQLVILEAMPEDTLEALNQKAAAFRKFENDYLDDMTDAQYEKYQEWCSAIKEATKVATKEATKVATEEAAAKLVAEIDEQLVILEAMPEDTLEALDQKAAAFRKFEGDYFDDMTDPQYEKYQELCSAVTAAIETANAKVVAESANTVPAPAADQAQVVVVEPASAASEDEGVATPEPAIASDKAPEEPVLDATSENGVVAGEEAGPTVTTEPASAASEDEEVATPEPAIASDQAYEESVLDTALENGLVAAAVEEVQSTVVVESANTVPAPAADQAQVVVVESPVNAVSGEDSEGQAFDVASENGLAAAAVAVEEVQSTLVAEFANAALPVPAIPKEDLQPTADPATPGQSPSRDFIRLMSPLGADTPVNGDSAEENNIFFESLSPYKSVPSSRESSPARGRGVAKDFPLAKQLFSGAQDDAQETLTSEAPTLTPPPGM